MTLPLKSGSLPVSDAPVKSPSAPIQEIFSSVQGEGIYVGKRQIFVRFAHCHLKCAYCDTPMTSPTGQCHVETTPGGETIELVENPVSPETLMNMIQLLLPQARHHSISFTGGEPLLYHGFLKDLFPRIQPLCKTYLETSGTQPDFLAHVLPAIDIIAMDIKLPSTTKEPDQFENHAAFYRLASTRPATELFIKLIVNNDTTQEEIEAVKAIVTHQQTPVILQPETSLTDGTVHINPAHLFRLEDALSAHFADVRVIPQTHKMLNVL